MYLGHLLLGEVSVQNLTFLLEEVKVHWFIPVCSLALFASLVHGKELRRRDKGWMIRGLQNLTSLLEDWNVILKVYGKAQGSVNKEDPKNNWKFQRRKAIQKGAFWSRTCVERLDCEKGREGTFWAVGMACLKGWAQESV